MISFTQQVVENLDRSVNLEEMLNVFKELCPQKAMNPKWFMEKLF